MDKDLIYDPYLDKLLAYHTNTVCTTCTSACELYKVCFPDYFKQDDDKDIPF